MPYDAQWLPGGPFPVTDRENCPWLDDELRFLAAFPRAHRPVVGLGLGGLLTAQAAGFLP